MLFQFMIDNRIAILADVERKTASLAGDKPVSATSARGIPEFFDQLVNDLRRQSKVACKRGGSAVDRKHGQLVTAAHGAELSRLGYTVSQVVHGYGVLCQGITELAATMKIAISATEFSALNLYLDIAIADAVTAFSKTELVESAGSTKRMGFLVHELRNALAAAIVAHSMVKKGVVGTGGSTNALLERNLNRMRDILDRSFAEVRMHGEKQAERESMSLIGVIEEVEATASEEARVKGLNLLVEADPSLRIVGDRSYLISALSNLVQNAIKYSKPGGSVWIRTRDGDAETVLEVEDRCGGLPKGRAEELFKPFTQKGSDRSGLGLGLTISRQAVALNGGTLSVRDLPGKGCIFSITIPKRTALRAQLSRAAAIVLPKAAAPEK